MKRAMHILLLGVALAAAMPACAAPPPLPSESLYQLPLPLTDQAGRHYDWRTLRGKPRVVAMFYTSCPYVCPLTIEATRRIDRALAPAERPRIGFVLLSMDPAHDTPPALKKVMDERKLDPARWTLASPRPEDVRALAGVLGIRYRQLAGGGFNHSTALVLLDADGRQIARDDDIGNELDAAFVAAVRTAAH